MSVVFPEETTVDLIGILEEALVAGGSDDWQIVDSITREVPTSTFSLRNSTVSSSHSTACIPTSGLQRTGVMKEQVVTTPSWEGNPPPPQGWSGL